MNQSKWFYHPILVFIFSLTALALSLFLYIYWYVRVRAGAEAIMQRFNLEPEQVLESETWVVILVLSVLVGIILLGIFTIFVYSQKIMHLYRLQHNFINNFTHELKTPVTSLKLYLETFLKHELPREDQVRYIHYMLQDVSRLADNAGRILDLGKIESRSYGGEFVEFDLVETVREFCRSNDHLFPNCVITVHNPSGHPHPYRFNPPLFQMLLMNLLTNAVKYNKSDVPRIDITFRRHNRRLYICFQDNGIGLAKGEIKKIFKKFYQVGHSDDMSARGSGIGLYIAQNVAKIHKGKIVAESSGIGNGSLFTVTLPLRS